MNSEKAKDAAADEIQLSARAFLEKMNSAEKAKHAAADEIQRGARAYLEKMRLAERSDAAPVDRHALLQGVYESMRSGESGFDLGAFSDKVGLAHAVPLAKASGSRLHRHRHRHRHRSWRSPVDWPLTAFAWPSYLAGEEQRVGEQRRALDPLPSEC